MVVKKQKLWVKQSVWITALLFDLCVIVDKLLVHLCLNVDLTLFL